MGDVIGPVAFSSIVAKREWLQSDFWRWFFSMTSLETMNTQQDPTHSNNLHLDDHLNEPYVYKMGMGKCFC